MKAAIRPTLHPVTAFLVMTFLSTAPLRAAPPNLTLRDTQSNPHTIPAQTPTLLLFLRADQQQSLDELSQLQPLLKDRTDLQVLAILSGDDAPANAPRLAEKCPWPIIADTNYAASGKFEVHVWPTTVLVGNSGGGGQNVVHIPGLPVSFATDLSAYLDFAAGRIDRAALDKRLANRDLVVDTSDQKAARHVEVAQRLAAQGMKDEARAEIAKALALNPTDGALLLNIARTELVTGDPDSAEKILDSAKWGGVSPMQVNTLKAWVAIQRNQFPAARQLLEQSITLNPDPAEADYLYGLVLQHDGDIPKAASYFRQAFEHTDLGKQFITATP
ncbi:MAG TPA: tetratricopeptide repeat protein [Phycisphaerae bacterium]|nr:tetratricopeptide repeat protein [Phycisphaerae bacterium]